MARPNIDGEKGNIMLLAQKILWRVSATASLARKMLWSAL
jgi:hypothetical protein